MGEIAAVAAAFDAEFVKAIASLPRRANCPPSAHDAHLNHHRAAQRIAESEAYYASRLPPAASVHRVLSHGDKLVSLQEYQLARSACYSYVAGLSLHTAKGIARMDEAARLSAHVQACFGIASCEAQLQLADDPQVKQAPTRDGLLHCLQQLQDTLELVLPHEQLYWLSLNGTVHIYSLAKRLIMAGFGEAGLPFLVYCIRALETHVTFSAAKFLPWRTQLYTSAAYAYTDLQSYAEGTALVKQGLDRLEAIMRLQKLDPVPALPAVQAAYKTAKALMCAIQLRMEVQAAGNMPSPAGGAAAALQPLLQQVAVSPKAKLTALLEAMQVPGRRVVRTEPVAGMMKELFDMARAEAAPMLAALQQACEAEVARKAAEAAAAEGDGAQPVALSAPAKYQAFEDFPQQLHKAFLCIAFNFEQTACFEELLQSAKVRLSAEVDTAERGAEEQAGTFAATTQLLGALHALSKQPGVESLTALSKTLQAAISLAGGHLNDMLTDAAIALHTSARPLLDGAFCASDKEAELVEHLLSVLHAVWEAVDLDDGALRAQTALKLALLQDDMEALNDALHVLHQAKVTIERFRSNALSVLQHAEDGRFRWITAGRNQPDENVASYVADMPDSEQELACLHVDMLALLFRVELRAGVAEQHRRADSTARRLTDAVTHREERATIFGARTTKERRADEQRIAEAGMSPSNAVAKERELLAACGKNPYEHALLLMQMAPFQADMHKQVAVLQEAAELLCRAQLNEDCAFAAMHPDLKSRREAPLPPQVLHRGPTSMTLQHFPLHLRSSKRAVKYAVLCKSFGAGVGLSLNKTAMEYPGSGNPVPLDSPITIQGLRSNDTYIFAIIAYDEAGAIINSLGSSTPELLAALPLPLYMCWAQLTLMACRLKLWALARRAMGVLAPHFIVTTPERPLWEANPMDAQTAHRAHLALAPKPLVRSLVQCIYAYTGAVFLQDTAVPPAMGATAASGPKDLKMPFLEEQVARLKSCKRLLIAMQLSVLLPDEMLVEEGAVRAYQLLAPLLTLKSKTPMLHKAMAAVQLGLTEVTNVAAESLMGQEHQRQLAARVTAAAAAHLIGAYGGEADEVTAMSHFARLEVALLKAYDPGFSIAGRPANTTRQPEAAAMQAMMLAHPRLPQMSAEVLAQRRADESDLAAHVLPMLSSPEPMDAWAKYLGKEEALDDPRWVELCVRMLEASARRGRTEGLTKLAEQVTWHVKSTLKVPPLSFDKWSLAAAVESSTFAPAPGELPPPPLMEGLSAVEAAAAKAKHEEDTPVAIYFAKKRTAAAVLLQKRLRVLLLRKRVIEGNRVKAARWAPWLSRLNCVLGLLATVDGRTFLANKAAAEPQVLSLEGGEITAAAAAAAATAADTAVDGPPPPPVQALLLLTRSVQLAYRGGAWHELVNSVRHLWNCSRMLLNADASLSAPTPKVIWQLGPVPPPATPPDNMIAPAAAVKGGKGAPPPKKADGKGKDDSKGKDAKGKDVKGKGKKGAEPEEAPGPMIWLAKGSRPSAARCLKSATEALLHMVSDLRSGTPLHTGVIPLGPEPTTSAAPTTPLTTGAMPAIAPLFAAHTTSLQPGALTTRATGSIAAGAATGYAPSVFSYGSDADEDKWFANSPLDMPAVARHVLMVLTVLQRSERWHGLMALGKEWVALSQAAFDETVLPLLLSAGPKAGVDTKGMAASMEALVRDKNVALDQLDKVRALVKERLGDVSILAAGGGHRMRKKRRIPAPPKGSRPGTARTNTSVGDDTGTADDNASLSSAYTARTGTTYKTKANQPDFTRLPVEYEKVIEVLKKRGERVHVVLATHELGDVHAHFGNWGGASTAWNDALDLILGPYQVLKNWRKHFGGHTSLQLLQTYGVHGLLMAGGVLLGKLARYSCFHNLQLRLEACRMSSKLLTAIFRGSIAHPQRNAGFATYVPRELWEGVELFSDPYRCNTTDLLSGLETVVSTLLDNSLALEALPLLSLWEHVARYVTRNLHSTALCRVLRARTLIQLGFMSEAGAVLVGLMAGVGLPDVVLDTDYVVKSADGNVLQAGPLPVFNNRAMPGDAANKAFALHLADNTPAPAVYKLYGPWLMAHLAMARALFLLCLGSVPNQWKLTHPATGLKVTSSTSLPEACEPLLLEKAGALITQALAMARNELEAPVDATGGAAAGGKGGTPKGTKAPPSPKGAKAPASPKGAKPLSPKGSASPSKTGPPDTPPGDRSGPPQEELVAAAQHGEVLARALLLQSELLLMQWQPAKALTAALEAAAHIGAQADVLNVPVFGNDDTERYSLTPTQWFLVRAQVVRCTARLGHAAACYSYITGAESEAAEVNEQLQLVGLQAVRAQLLVLEGRQAAAMNVFREVHTSYGQLNIDDSRLGTALLDAACLRDRIGLRSDSAALATASTACFSHLTSALGLSEQQEHAEQINLYTAGTALYAESLLRMVVVKARRAEFASSADDAQLALKLLRGYTLAVPAQHAAAALAVGRALRNTAMSSEQTSVASAAAQLSSAREALTSAITVSCLDGGHDHSLMRCVLLELAAIHTASQDASKAAACLRSAANVAARGAALTSASHTLVPVTTNTVPDWATTFVKGQEAFFVQAHTPKLPPGSLSVTIPTADAAPPPAAAKAKAGGVGGAAAGAADLELGRIAVRHFLRLVCCAVEGTMPVGERQLGLAQLAALHGALKAGCPKYVSDVCCMEVPMPTEAPPAPLPAGMVTMQWHAQDGCWLEPASWDDSGSIPYNPITDKDVMALRPSPAYASLLYVLVPPADTAASPAAAPVPPTPSGKGGAAAATPAVVGGEPLCGEVCCSVAAVRKLQRMVQELRFRAEAPKAPTDLFGAEAPIPLELTDARDAVAAFLGGLSASANSGAGASPLPSPRGVPGNGEGGSGAPVADVALLTKLEALLCVDAGLELTDVAVAGWLANILPAGI